MSLGCVQETVAAIFAPYLDAAKAFTQVLYLKINKGKMTKITDLPIEIIAKILTFLPAEDHASMSQVCKMFYEASKIEYVWLNRCREEFNIDTSKEEFTSKEIYTKLLYRYGFLLGFWQPEVLAYGGLFHVQYSKASLIGSALVPFSGSDIRFPLERTAQFRIELDERNGDVCTKCICFNEVHKGCIKKMTINKFAFDCLEVDYHSYQTNILERDDVMRLSNSLRPRIVEDPLGRQTEELRLIKRLAHWEQRFCYKYNRVFLPKKRTNVPIQPGVFKGTYGAHGLEIIMLDYDGTLAKAVKVSGDPNVPAGKITFLADLQKSMVLTLGDQNSVIQLDELSFVDKDYDSSINRTQPFKVPKECQERFPDVPRSCIARFFASGHIAGYDFNNASYTNGHWIIFNEDLFGFLWLELLSLSMFSRAKEVV